MPFGDAQVPFLIRRDGGGFFSMMSTVLCQLQRSEQLNFIPVVDLENSQTVYKEDEPVNGSKNPWEYYFNPVSGMSLGQARSSNLFVESDGQHPHGMTQSISTDPDLLRVFNKFVTLNSSTDRIVNDSTSSIDERTLGVHFRGNEMRTATSHPLTMTLRQCKAIVNEQLETGNFSRILLVTEGQQYVNYFKRHFGDKLTVTDTYRLWKRNAYKVYPRGQHRYRLGLEAIVDAYSLAKCGGLICSSSNLAEFSILLNDGKYSTLIEVNNGTNSSNRIISEFSWYARAALPLGSTKGLQNKIRSSIQSTPQA